MLLILAVDHVAQRCLDLTRRQFLTVLGGDGIAEEVAQRERAPARERILGIADTRNCREIEPRLLGHILENHRAQRRLIAIDEELVLQLYDGPHGDGKRVAAHLHGLDEALCGIHLFLDIEQRLLGLPAQILLILLILFHRISKRLRHLQLGHFTIVEREGDGTVVLGIDNEVGRYLLHTPAHGLTQ